MVNRAVTYATWAIHETERKVPIYVKKQCQQWLAIYNGESKLAFFDEKAYEKICKILKLIIHPDLRKNMYESLEDYAFLFIVAILCTKELRQDDEDVRYYRTGLLEIARKNFKTFVSAVIFIILLLVEPRFSRFFSVAPDYNLSCELKDAIYKIIKSSPLLWNEKRKAFDLLRSEIRCKLTESEYKPLAYSRDGMDGKRPNAFLADEAGALDSYPVEAMRSGQIMLQNKTGIIISTQYPNDNNVFIDEIDVAKKNLDGLLETRIFSLLYEPDEDLYSNEKWQTEDRILYQANPVTLHYDYVFEDLKGKRALAVLYENKRENFLCKHCNILYKGIGVEGYIDIEKVKNCKIVDDPLFWNGKRVFLGLDLSQTEDNTALAMVTQINGEYYAKVWGFIPTNRVDAKTKKESVDYERMIRLGYCFKCGDEVVDYNFVEEFVLGGGKFFKESLEQRYGVEIVQIGYDRYNALSTVQKFEREGYSTVEIKQHSSVLHPATKRLKELILSQHFKYFENRLLEINFSNARCTEDTNLNKYVNKKKSSGKVDMVVALINAMHLAILDEEDSSYFVFQF